MQDIAQRIRDIRTQRGISMVALSLNAGLSHDYIRHLEIGRITSPSVNALMRICAELGVSISEVVDCSTKGKKKIRKKAA